MTPRWLKLRDAAKYSAIGINRLRQMGREGIIIGFPDPDNRRGDWVFDRNSLDAYRESQIRPTAKSVVKKQASEILSKISRG